MSRLPGTWQLDLVAPSRLQWGHWLLPLSERISVESDGVTALVRLSAGGNAVSIPFQVVENQWETMAASATPLPRIGHTPPGIVLLAADGVGGRKLAPSLPPVIAQVPNASVQHWQTALAFIETYAPIYDQWVQLVIRQVALLEQQIGTVQSGSYQYRYGFIHASAEASVPSLAEALVHEASHQYFYMLSRLGPVDDGTDTKTYFSPFVGRDRPIDRILLACHACANILLFYQLCQDNRAPDSGYCASQMDLVYDQFQQLAAPLMNNTSLTWVGRALYEPLVERLPL